MYRSDAVETVKTRKIEEHKVVIQPAKEHPGQFVKVTEDVAVGTWKTIHRSRQCRWSSFGRSVLCDA